MPIGYPKLVYLDERFLSWNLWISSWVEIDGDVRARAEALLERSESHIRTHKSKDCRADCLLTLKRALNQRLKALEEIHEFKKLDIPDKPKNYFELMEKIGVVRPLLLEKLLKIRNNIEHDDSDPPSYNQCKEFVDVVWYFLKSTNKLVSIKAKTVTFQKLNGDGTETQYGGELRVGPNHFERVEIHGLFPKSYLKENAQKINCISLNAEIMHTKEERWADNEGHRGKIPEGHRSKRPTNTWVSGHMNLSALQRLDLVRKIMNI